jgi:hypothetical protein
LYQVNFPQRQRKKVTKTLSNQSTNRNSVLLIAINDRVKIPRIDFSHNGNTDLLLFSHSAYGSETFGCAASAYSAEKKAQARRVP